MFITFSSYSQTPITDANLRQAIETCLSTNPVDGLCDQCEYGSMPNWDIGNVTDMSDAFLEKTMLNADISSWDVSSVTDVYFMFADATSFNQDLFSWDVTSVRSCTDFSTNATAWTLPKPTFTNCNALSIEDNGINDISFSIYPNPTNRVINILNDKPNIDVLIFDVTGKQVLHKKETYQIDVRSLSNGIYFMRLSDGTNTSVKKIIKI